MKLIKGAFSVEPGILQLVDPGHGEWGYRTGKNNNSFVDEVRAYSINEFTINEATPFILKVDIEGGEASIFDKNIEIFNKFPIVIIELHDWMLPRGKTSNSFLRWHCSNNRDFLQFGENIFSLSNEVLGQVD